MANSKKTKKDIIVVAREGYSVILDVEKDSLDINCHTPVNLSELFSTETLEKCSSLKTHLKAGNLVLYEGQALSKDPNDQRIAALKPQQTTKLEVSYSQATPTARKDIGIATNTEMGEITPQTLSEQVEKGREEIMATAQKANANQLKRTVQEVNPDKSPKETQMTEAQLHMQVSMDVSPTEFAQKQKEARARLDKEEEISETAAQNEIAATIKREQEETE